MNGSVPALPRIAVFGEALTDLVRTGDDSWRSVAGGACWNVARVAATLGVPTGWGGAASDDLFGRQIVALSREAGLDPRFLQVVPRPPLLAVVHQLDPPDYFFIGEDSADLAFDEARLPPGWEAECAFAHFGCISLVRQPLGERLVALALRLADAGVPVSFDPNCRNLMGADYPPLFERLAARAAVLKISDEDLRRIYPAMDAADALARVRMLAPDAVLLYTRGAAGMTVYAPGAATGPLPGSPASWAPTVAPSPAAAVVGAGLARDRGVVSGPVPGSPASWPPAGGAAPGNAVAGAQPAGDRGTASGPTDADCFTQPAFAVGVVDTVGAGDACIGGFLASRLLYPQASLREHARFAAATAAAACTRAGAHAPSRDEVERLLDATR